VQPLLGLWKRLEAKELGRQIGAYVSRIQISERFRDRALTHLRGFHDREIARRNEILQSQQRAYEDCLKRLAHLVKLKTSPKSADGSRLSDEEYGHQRVEFLKEKVWLAELLRDTDHRVDQWLELSEKTFEFACMARQWFARGIWGSKTGSSRRSDRTSS
jgi:hypothetical protein